MTASLCVYRMKTQESQKEKTFGPLTPCFFKSTLKLSPFFFPRNIRLSYLSTDSRAWCAVTQPWARQTTSPPRCSSLRAAMVSMAGNATGGPSASLSTSCWLVSSPPRRSCRPLILQINPFQYNAVVSTLRQVRLPFMPSHWSGPMGRS